MSDDSLNLKNDLERKWKGLKNLVNHPRLHVTEYFYSIRNEIDLATESVLSQLSESSSEDDQKAVRINSIRKDLVQELSKHEKLMLDQLNGIENSRDTVDAKEKCESIGRATEQLFSSQNIDINDLEDQYEKLMTEIFDEACKCEKRILFNQTFVFLSAESDWGFPGLLVYLADDFMNQIEIDCFK